MPKKNCFIALTDKTKLLVLILFFTSGHLYSQSTPDSIIDKIDPQKFSNTIGKKASSLEEKLISKSEETLRRMQKQEEKIYKNLLASKDSVFAKMRLNEIRDRYTSLQAKLKNPIDEKLQSSIRSYVPQLDSLGSALKFLGNNNLNGNINEALSKVESLNGRLQQAEEIKQFIKERREQIKQALSSLGIVKDLTKINKEVYYYSQQIKEYKEILKDQKKVEQKAMELLSKTKVFQDFMKKNSLLASLFRMPDATNNSSLQASLAGLQTRAQVNSLVQTQLASGGSNGFQSFQQNVQQAQAQLQLIKNKINGLGGGSSGDIMPEGFKPNDQKTKSFLKRLEYGTNIQTQRATNFFPITTDVGLSLGYKLNDKSIVGFGASYKMGMGTGWNNIRFSQQGAGLRSFIDMKLKGSIWISGGYEKNYRAQIDAVNPQENISAWQQSGLIGISKVVSVKSKLFKKTKVQLLWDFLSYQQVPRTQPIVFRLGYNIR